MSLKDEISSQSYAAVIPLSINPSSQYKTPPGIVMARLPSSLVPYAELARIDKPMACLYLYFPCLFGTLLVALLSESIILPDRLVRVNLTFLLGSYLVRCAGCTWNDIVDQDVDRKVIRTRFRPLARRAISTPKALVFNVTQVLMGLVLLSLLLPDPCLYYSMPSIFLTALYPYAKRFTNYPQLILGCVFSWGVVMASPALGLSPFATFRASATSGSLFLSSIAWTMVYDTIYAAQDIKDDVRIGIKSPVVRHQGHTRRLLGISALVQVGLLCLIGIIMNASAAYFTGTCFGAALILGTMVSKVDLDSPKNCMWWFSIGCFYTGAAIASGFVCEYVMRICQ